MLRDARSLPKRARACFGGGARGVDETGAGHYLRIDGEFLGLLAELGIDDALIHKSEFEAFFSDEPFESDL